MAYDNEIPVARRVIRKKSPPLLRLARSLPLWAYGVGITAFLLSIFLAALFTPRSSQTAPVVEPKPIVRPSPSPVDTLLGHRAFREAPPESLITIGLASDGYALQLRPAAADAFLRMQADARGDGIELEVISAFRSKEEQKHLFFEISKSRNQTPAERAQVSAPPGYSEHHTGYVVDLGDAANPSTHLSESFEKTDAFQWLQQNAPRYGFELSFPRNNPQRVLYEPWHWRFVGDEDSLKTFYKNPVG